MSTSAEDEFFKWHEEDLRRTREQEIRSERADRYARQKTSTTPVPGFMGFFRRLPY